MSNTITLYMNPMSRGRIVRWMLEELDVPYEVKILEYGTTMKAPEYLAINPMGKVPAIEHNGTVVTETAAICAYLADQFPEKMLAPAPASPERGAYYRWLFFAAGAVEPAAFCKKQGLEITDERRSMSPFGTYSETFEVLRQAVSAHDYVCGDTFTAADVYVASCIGFYMQFGLIDSHPDFEAYLSRMMSRPAAIKARALDDALAANGQGS